jgi:hypothetical protein
LAGYHAYHATRADLLRRLGRSQKSRGLRQSHRAGGQHRLPICLCWRGRAGIDAQARRATQHRQVAWGDHGPAVLVEPADDRLGPVRYGDQLLLLAMVEDEEVLVVVVAAAAAPAISSVMYRGSGSVPR